MVDLHDDIAVLQHQESLRAVVAADCAALTPFRCDARRHGLIDLFPYC
jgi:hypothetical protein